MMGKFISLLFWLCMGAGFGVFLADSPKYHLLHSTLGMLVVAVILYIYEISQIYKFSAWLRQPNLDTNLKVGAGLDEATDRILRLIKNKDKLIGIYTIPAIEIARFCTLNFLEKISVIIIKAITNGSALLPKKLILTPLMVKSTGPSVIIIKQPTTNKPHLCTALIFL